MTVDHQIRRAVSADLGAVIRVFYRAFRHGYRTVLPDDVVDGIEQIRPPHRFAALAALPGGQMLLAEQDGAVVGFTRVTPEDDQPGTGCVQALYVDPGYAGRGIGRSLLNAACTALREQGYDEALLWVFAGNTRARRLYGSMGFAPDGATQVSADFRATEIRMRRSLTNGGAVGQ